AGQAERDDQDDRGGPDDQPGEGQGGLDRMLAKPVHGHAEDFFVEHVGNAARSALLAGGADLRAVRERDGSGQDDRVLPADARDDLDLGQAEQPDRDVASAGPSAVEDVDVAPVPVAKDARPRHDQGAGLFAGDDRDVHGGVGGQLTLRIGDLAEHFSDL